MHEMSLAESVIQIIEDQARQDGFQKVTEVVLEIGRLSGVEADAMRFCFDAVGRGGVAEGAALLIEEPAGEGHCLDCENHFEALEKWPACPACGGYQVQTQGGDAMRVKELAVE